MAATPNPVRGKQYFTVRPRQEGASQAPESYHPSPSPRPRLDPGRRAAELFAQAAALMARARDLMRAAVEAERQELERVGDGR
jgi:hypothetical protein